MTAAHPLERFPIFWDASAEVVYRKDRDSSLDTATLVRTFEKPVLIRLLQLLSSDRKLFLSALKMTGSLGLSGFLCTYFRSLVGIRSPYGYDDTPDLFTDIILPYSRILWRYLLLPPISDEEEKARAYLQDLSSSFARLNTDKPVDVEDARNVLQEFNERLEELNSPTIFTGCVLIRLVAPLVIPGCEDLVPTTLKLSIDLMWNSLLGGRDSNEVVRYMVTYFLFYLRDMFKALKPRHFTNQPWIWEIVDHVVQKDVLELTLRTMLTAPSFSTKDLSHTEAELFLATIEFYVALEKLAPHPDFTLRFYDSGRLGDWFKYYFSGFFSLYGNEKTLRDFDNPTDEVSPDRACGEIISAVMGVVIGPSRKWADIFCEMVDSCDNPRCPWPFSARYFCMNCFDLTYCGTQCLTADWMYAWGGPHSSVCEHQARRNIHSRKRYHRIVNIPQSVEEGFSGRDTQMLAKLVDDHFRAKRAKSKESSFGSLVLYKDNGTKTYKLDPKVGFV